MTTEGGFDGKFGRKAVLEETRYHKDHYKYEPNSSPDPKDAKDKEDMHGRRKSRKQPLAKPHLQHGEEDPIMRRNEEFMHEMRATRDDGDRSRAIEMTEERIRKHDFNDM